MSREIISRTTQSEINKEVVIPVSFLLRFWSFDLSAFFAPSRDPKRKWALGRALRIDANRSPVGVSFCQGKTLRGRHDHHYCAVHIRKLQ
jgi:hypothetical protein